MMDPSTTPSSAAEDAEEEATGTDSKEATETVETSTEQETPVEDAAEQMRQKLEARKAVVEAEETATDLTEESLVIEAPEPSTDESEVLRTTDVDTEAVAATASAGESVAAPPHFEGSEGCPPGEDSSLAPEVVLEPPSVTVTASSEDIPVVEVVDDEEIVETEVTLEPPSVEETAPRVDIPVVEVIDDEEIVETEILSVPLTPPAANQRAASSGGELLVAEVVTVPLTPPADDGSEFLVEEAEDLPTAEVVSMSTAAPVFRQPPQMGNVPPAVVPPRGLAGIFDDYDPDELLDTSRFPRGTVLLNVYDVGSTEDELVQKVNKITTGNNNLLVGGVFHAGVEVYGEEWMYGFSSEGNTGVCSTLPRMNPQHTYRTTVPLGRTKKSEEEVKQLLSQMAQDWRGHEYHLLHRNCLNFSREFCKELGVRHVPGWVDRASRAGSIIDHSSRAVADGVRQTAAIARTISTDVQEIAKSMTTDLDRTLRNEGEAAETFVSDIGEAVRRQSTQALETVAETDFGKNAQELGEVAAAKAQVLHETVVAKTKELGESAQELLGEDIAERAQETAQMLSETVQAHSQAVVEVAQGIHEDLADQAQVLHEKAQEHAQVIHEKAQEHAQVISQNFFKWGAELRQAAARVLGDEPADRGAHSRDPWGLLPAGGFLSSNGRVEMQDPPLPGYLQANHGRSTRGKPVVTESDGTAIAVDDQE